MHILISIKESQSKTWDGVCIDVTQTPTFSINLLKMYSCRREHEAEEGIKIEQASDMQVYRT